MKQTNRPTIEPSMCGGDAAFCQITLIACYTHLSQCEIQRRLFADNAVVVSRLFSLTVSRFKQVILTLNC